METSLARDLMSDEEWAFHERFILAVRAPNGRKPLNHRVVLDGILWIARTGSPWCDLPEEFGKWSSFYRQLRRWTLTEVVSTAGSGNRRLRQAGWRSTKAGWRRVGFRVGRFDGRARTGGIG
jgi:transposase